MSSIRCIVHHLRGVMATVVLGAVALIAASVPVRAEKLVLGLSTNVFEISSNFNGGEILVFGTIEKDAVSIARRGQYDIAVVVRGPAADLVTRRKERVGIIWINRSSETFPASPLYYATLSSRPVNDLARREQLQTRGIGTANLRLRSVFGSQHAVDTATEAVFRAALIERKKGDELYRDVPDAVTFLSKDLFKATIPLPPSVPVGRFDATVYLFRDGVILAQANTNFTIRKTGFEHFMYAAAHDRPLLYGLGAVLAAIVTGWAGGVIFRRD